MTLAIILLVVAIVLILLALFGKFFGNDRRVYCWTIGLTLLAALYDLLRTLPEGLRAGLHLDGDIVWKTQMLVRGPRSMPIGW